MRTEISRITKYPSRGLPSIGVLAGEDKDRQLRLEVTTGGIRAEKRYSAAKLARWPVRLTKRNDARGQTLSRSVKAISFIGDKGCFAFSSGADLKTSLRR